MKKYGKLVGAISVAISFISLFLPMIKTRFMGMRCTAFEILGNENAFAGILPMIGMVIIIATVFAGKKWFGFIGLALMIWFAYAMFVAASDQRVSGFVALDIGYFLYVMGIIGCCAGIIIAE